MTVKLLLDLVDHQDITMPQKHLSVKDIGMRPVGSASLLDLE
jgi:hypothetical protein